MKKSFVLDRNIISHHFDDLVNSPLLNKIKSQKIEIVVCEQLLQETINSPSNSKQHLSYIAQLTGHHSRWYRGLNYILAAELAKSRNRKFYFHSCAFQKESRKNILSDSHTKPIESLIDTNKRKPLKATQDKLMSVLRSRDKLASLGEFSTWFELDFEKLAKIQIEAITQANKGIVNFPKSSLNNYINNPKGFPFNYYALKFYFFTLFHALNEKNQRRDDGSIHFDNDYLTIAHRHNGLITNDKKATPTAFNTIYGENKQILNFEEFMTYLDALN